MAAHLLKLLAGTNLRPQELKNLTPSCFHLKAMQPYLKTLPTKFRPNGRSVDLSPMMVGCVTWILKQISKSSGTIVPQITTFMRQLQLTMRKLITSDPEKLPMVTLYATRHYYCTRMWSLGASSAWLMDQMSHRNWKTTCIYIHGDSVPAWRDAFTGELPLSLELPLSAESAPCLQQPDKTKAWLAKRRKTQEIEAEEEIEDSDLILDAYS